VLHSGNNEVIGIRQRGSQTLFVSDVIKPHQCVNPGYGKIHVGIVIAAVRDAMDRMEQDDKHVDDGGQGEGGPGAGDGGSGAGGSGAGGGGPGAGGLEHSKGKGVGGQVAERLAIEVCIFALTRSIFQ
jgi:hypothetical protein